jgi:hypothetical protein
MAMANDAVGDSAKGWPGPTDRPSEPPPSRSLASLAGPGCIKKGFSAIAARHVAW